MLVPLNQIWPWYLVEWEERRRKKRERERRQTKEEKEKKVINSR